MNMTDNPVTRGVNSRGASTVTKYHRQRVLRAFSELGYAIDLTTQYITVLRATTFPFTRITLPSHEVISLELLKHYARDHEIDLKLLKEKVNA